jgi:hypothetical protein
MGPFIFNEATVNGECHHAILQDFLIPVLRQLLNDVFPNRWTGRAESIPWPPHSCDLTPLVYFLWGCVETVMYSSKPYSLAEQVSSN